MTNSKMQITSDTTMGTILEANAVRVYQSKEEKVLSEAEQVPSKEEQVICTETGFCDRKWHVDDEGWVTFVA
jgi:hypothetical protein